MLADTNLSEVKAHCLRFLQTLFWKNDVRIISSSFLLTAWNWKRKDLLVPWGLLSTPHILDSVALNQIIMRELKSLIYMHRRMHLDKSWVGLTRWSRRISGDYRNVYTCIAQLRKCILPTTTGRRGFNIISAMDNPWHSNLIYFGAC